MWVKYRVIVSNPLFSFEIFYPKDKPLYNTQCQSRGTVGTYIGFGQVSVIIGKDRYPRYNQIFP